MKPIRRHVLFCTGSKCKKKGGKKALKHMKRALKNTKQSFVRCSKTACLGACKHAPVMVVYPDGTWYSDASSKSEIADIVDQHICNGKPIHDNVLHQMPDNKKT